MGSNKFRFLILLAVLAVILLPTPVLAIDDPDSISMESVKAYSGLWEEDDALFVIEYKVMYDPDPSEDPEDTFLAGVWDETETKGPDRELNYYQHNFISIYLTAAQATSFGYARNDELKIRVVGNPSYFESLVEGTNMKTRTLTEANWIRGSSIEETRSYLADWCIVLAEVLEDSWGDVVLLTASEKLNTTGKLKFEEAIPGLQSICPDIFQVSTSYPDQPPEAGNATFQTTLFGNTGARLTSALDGLGDMVFGREGMGVFIGGIGLAVLFFILAGRIFIATGSVPGAVAISIPFLFTGNLIGVLPLTITFIAAFIVVLLFGVTFILGRV